MTKKSKRFDFDYYTENKLQEILAKQKREASITNQKTPTQTDIVKGAIDLLHANTFSDNYNDIVLEKIERMIGNRVERVISEMFGVLQTFYIDKL